MELQDKMISEMMNVGVYSPVLEDHLKMTSYIEVSCCFHYIEHCENA